MNPFRKFESMFPKLEARTFAFTRRPSITLAQEGLFSSNYRDQGDTRVVIDSSKRVSTPL